MLVSPIYSSSQGSQQTIIHKQVWLSRLCKKASRNNVVRKPFLKERKTTITEGYKIAYLNQLNFVRIGFIFITSQLPLLATSPPPSPSPSKRIFFSQSESLWRSEYHGNKEKWKLFKLLWLRMWLGKQVVSLKTEKKLNKDHDWDLIRPDDTWKTIFSVESVTFLFCLVLQFP